ncbi:MAG TPA: hypothetical protein VOA19_02330 [Actinomycetes bacterium]|nr:hypothetical protein [Actinomycetes bacterium]
MSASTLFPESMTPSTGPLANLEPHVVWLQRSLQPEAAARRRVNAWYQNFRDPDGQLAPGAPAPTTRPTTSPSTSSTSTRRFAG